MKNYLLPSLFGAPLLASRVFSGLFIQSANIAGRCGVDGGGFLFSVRAPSLLMNFTLLKGNCE
jgi:hypothetical protein